MVREVHPPMAPDQHSPTETDRPETAPEHPLGRQLALEATLHQVFGIGEKPQPTIARYAIERRLGAGGMSEVFLADDPELRRQVAIKVLNHRFAASEQRRLLREGWALASVKHPNVVGVYDVGFEHGRAFLVMEHLEGETLDRWLHAQPRSLVDILDLLLPLCEGLAEIHGRGVVHRDLKPQNIIVGPKRGATLIDFGLIVDEDLETQTATPKHRLDKPLAGTVAYMSPEQALASSRLDSRSDQFSLAIVVYEAVFGTRPFLGKGASLLRAIAELPPQPPTRMRWRERLLWRALRRALAKDPAARYPDMRAFVAALRRIVDGPRRLSRGLAIGAALSAVALIGTTVPPELHHQACLGEATSAWPTLRELPDGPLRSRLVAYGDSWSSAWANGCDLAHRQGQLSVDLGLPLRQACLWEAEAIVEAALRELEGSSSSAHDQLLQAELPPLSACEAGPTIRGHRPYPLGEAEVVETINTSIQTAETRFLLGRLGDAEASAREAVQQATHIDHQWTRARASFTLGRILRRAEAPQAGAVVDHLKRAANDAIADQDRLLAIWTLHEAARAAVLLGDDAMEALAFLDHAEAELRALDGLAPASAAPLWASQHDIRGLIHYRAGAIDAARDAHQRAIDTLLGSGELDDESRRLLAAAYLNLSRTLDEGTARADALDHAYDLETSLYGAEHPTIAAIRHSQAHAAARAGHLLQARTLAEEALLLLAQDDSTGVIRQRAWTTILMSELHLQGGRFEEALALAAEAEAILVEQDKARGVHLLQARRLRGASLRALGRLDEAARIDEAIADQCLSDDTLDSDDLADVLLDQAKARIDEGNPSAALDILTALGDRIGTSARHWPSLEMIRGWALADMGRFDDAIISLERGIETGVAGHLGGERARSQWALAEALIKTGGDRRRICTLLAACSEFYGAQEAPALHAELSRIGASQGCAPSTSNPTSQTSP